MKNIKNYLARKDFIKREKKINFFNAKNKRFSYQKHKKEIVIGNFT